MSFILSIHIVYKMGASISSLTEQLEKQRREKERPENDRLFAEAMAKSEKEMNDAVLYTIRLANYKNSIEISNAKNNLPPVK